METQSYFTCNSLYCKETNGNACLLDKPNHIFKGINNLPPLILGSAPPAEGSYTALGYCFRIFASEFAGSLYFFIFLN